MNNVAAALPQYEASYASVCSTIQDLLSKPPMNPLDLVKLVEISQRIHLQLVKYRSRSSKTLTRTLGLKRKIAEHQARDVIRDKRFTRGNTLNKLKDLHPSLTINLHANHFKLDSVDDLFAYDGPMETLLRAILSGRLLPDVLDILDEGRCTFYDGCILVDVHDHRVTDFTLHGAHHLPDGKTFISYRLILVPTSDTFMADLNSFNDVTGNCLSQESLLSAESRILVATETNICLNPSPDVGRIAGIVEYNKSKFIRRTRHKRTSSRSAPASGLQYDPTLDASLDKILQIAPGGWLTTMKNNSTSHGFQQATYIEEWRRRKLITDATPSIRVDKSGKGVASSLWGSQGQIETVVRTLKFIQKSSGIAHLSSQELHTCLQIILRSDGLYSGVLRLGKRPETSVGGETIRFYIGDSVATENYVRSFLSIYCQAENNQLVSDQKYQQDLSSVNHRLGANGYSDFPRQQVQSRNAAALSQASKNHREFLSGGIRVGSQPVSASSTPRPGYSPTPAVMSPPLPTAAIQSFPATMNASNTVTAETIAFPASSSLSHGDGQHSAISGHSQSSTVRMQRSQGRSGYDAHSVGVAQNQQQQSRLANVHGSATASSHIINANTVNDSGIQSSRSPAGSPATPNSGVLNKQNTIFLQALLRLPYDQVPERHKPLYLNLKNRLANNPPRQQQQQLAQQPGATQSQYVNPLHFATTSPQLQTPGMLQPQHSHQHQRLVAAAAQQRQVQIQQIQQAAQRNQQQYQQQTASVHQPVQVGPVNNSVSQQQQQALQQHMNFQLQQALQQQLMAQSNASFQVGGASPASGLGLNVNLGFTPAQVSMLAASGISTNATGAHVQRTGPSSLTAQQQQQLQIASLHPQGSLQSQGNGDGQPQKIPPANHGMAARFQQQPRR